MLHSKRWVAPGRAPGHLARLPVRAGALALPLLAALVPTLAAAAPATYPLAQVRRGQTGYGLTTFKGTTPERFTFEVVSVVTNFLPKQDIILVKSDDPKVQITGFWQGMSGSPLYLDDKLVCAFSYGFRFNKIALGGCTPIEYMKREGLETQRRGAPGAAAGTPSAGAGAQRLSRAFELDSGLSALGPPRQSWLSSAPMPALPTAPRAGATEHTLTASVPLAVAGFTAPAFADLSKLLSGYNLEPMRTGGTSVAGEPVPRELTMGGSVAVQLVRGDMSMAATGTVSYIDGNRVLAFGHPLFQTGEMYAPVSTSYVHTVIPSAQNAFVSASPGVEVGSLVQDRQSMISADTKLRSPMIPMNIDIVAGTSARTEKGSFRVELIDNKFFTATFAALTAANAITYYLPDRDDVTAKVLSTVRVRGIPPITFTDYLYAADGAGSLMGGVRGLRALVPLLLNPYEPVAIESIDLQVDLRFDTNFGEIRELRLPSGTLVAGARNQVTVVMDTWNGEAIVETVPVDVPANLAGAIVQLELAAGDSAKLDAAPPVDLPSLVQVLRKMLPGNVWAASLYVSEDGAAIEGKVVRDLPPSMADKLRPASRSQRVLPFRPVARTVSPSRRVLNGTATLLARVVSASSSSARGATP